MLVHKRVQTILIFICCMVLLVADRNGSFGQTPQPDPQVELDEIQNQIIMLRNEFKLRMQRAEEDRQTIQQYIQAKLEDLLTGQEPLNTTYPDLDEGVAQLEAVLAAYDQNITALEERLDTIEALMHEHLDAIEITLTQIKAHGIQRASGDSQSIADSSETNPQDPLPNTEFPPGQLFRAAYRFYMEGDYDTAIAGFEKYLYDYPETELAGAAQYWIAESLVKLEEYEFAIQEYDRLIRQYPQDEKLADGYYGKGVALLKMENTAEAKSLFLYVRDHFPGTIAEQKALNRLEELP